MGNPGVPKGEKIGLRQFRVKFRVSSAIHDSAKQTLNITQNRREKYHGE